MRRLIIGLALLLVSFFLVMGLDLPDAPEGFGWREVKRIRGAFLVPDGWHFTAEQAKETLAFFITETELKPSEKFLVGVSVNVFLGNEGAPAQVEQHLRAQAEHYSVDLVPGGFGPFLTLQCQYDLAKTEEHGEIRIFHLGILNPKTNASYLIMFESPVERWEQTWPKGEVIVKTLALSDEI